jgi:hypothetical protein
VSLNIIPFLEAQMKNTTQCIDAVWNNYPEENNFKALTQERRGNGPRTRVGDGSTPIPKRKWNSAFLKNVENKKKLFSLISTQISKIDMDGKILLSIHFETVSIEDCDLKTLLPCNHSEADTRILLHLAHAVQQGHTAAYVRTVDSDVVVLTVRFFYTLGLSQLWVGFGTGKKYRDIPVHVLHSNLGPSNLSRYPSSTA